MTGAPIPRARVPVGMVHHPAGTSRATGQALAEHSSEDSVKAGPYARSSSVLGSSPRMTRPSPPCQRDACSGNRRRTRRRKEPHTLLRQVASGASSDPSGQARGQVSNHPEGVDPDRRRSLGFLKSTDHPHPEVPDTSGPRRARPPYINAEECFEARASRGHLSMRAFNRPQSPWAPWGEKQDTGTNCN
ncbi:hypothetical protein BSY240_938 [Agrobacterium sp. RAC06]|nr:hypothetical protein BSY240_938 [Agrobacterium sp. RAC06]